MADESPAAAPMVRLFNPKLGRAAEFPAENVEKAKALGWEPEISTAKAALHGVGHGATLGFADELLGAANAATEIPQALREGSTDRLAKAYREGRDTAREDAASAHEQHPYAYNAGQAAGSVLPALAAPGGIGAQAALGAAQGLGETADIGDAAQVAKDVAGGAAAGAALPAVAKGASLAAKVFKPQLETAAAKALLHSTGITADGLGVGSRKEAEELAKRALQEPGLVPGLSKPASAANVAENAARTKAAAAQALDATYAPLDAQGANINGRRLAREIHGAASEAATLKKSLAPHVAEAVRAVDPAGYDGVKAQALRLHGPTYVHRLESQQPWVFIDPNKNLNLTQTQKVINDLRKLGGYPEHASTATELSAKKDVYTPAWDTAAEQLRMSAAGVGGPQARQAVDAARKRYGLNATVESAARAADKTTRSAPPLVSSAAKAGAAAAGGAALGGTPGAAAAAVAEPLLEHVIGPRVPQALHGIAQANGNVPPHASSFLGTFGRLFQSQTPERKVQIDHKLQEMSPRYRELRRKAEKEHDDKEKTLPQRPETPID